MCSCESSTALIRRRVELKSRMQLLVNSTKMERRLKREEVQSLYPERSRA